MIMLSMHLIFIVISFFAVVIIYGSSSTFVIDAKKESSCTISEGMATCCWDVECEGGGTEEHCMNCKQKSNGQWECGSVFTPGLVGTLMCPVKPDTGLAVKTPDDDSLSPKIKELLGSGLLDNPTIQPGNDSTILPKGNKGLLGLLDENNHSIQQPLSETNTPKKDTTTDLLSNFDDNIMTNDDKTSVSKQGELLSLQDEEEQKSSITESDSDNANILKDKDKEEEEETEEEEGQDDDRIICIRAPCPNPNSNDKQEQLSANEGNEIQSEETEEEGQDDDRIICIMAPCPNSNSNDKQDQLSTNREDEIQSEETQDGEKENNDGQEQQEEQPPLTETFNPNTELVE